MTEQILQAIESLRQETNARLEAMQTHILSVVRDVDFIRGKLEGREKAAIGARARRAEWIAAAAMLVAIGALIKSFI